MNEIPVQPVCHSHLPDLPTGRQACRESFFSMAGSKGKNKVPDKGVT